MSNNYNSDLQSNNADLQAILDAINKLPEAGGGESTVATYDGKWEVTQWQST